jgi:hypothetical protein
MTNKQSYIKSPTVKFQKGLDAYITHDILRSTDLFYKHHLAPKYSGAPSLEVALPLSFLDPVS